MVLYHRQLFALRDQLEEFSNFDFYGLLASGCGPNTASFQTNGNLRWFSEKHVFPPHTAKWLGKWVSYSVDHWEFDCTDKRAKLDARSDIYEDGTLWVADAPLLSSTAWHGVEGDAWKEGEMKLLCERVRPDTFSTR